MDQAQSSDKRTSTETFEYFLKCDQGVHLRASFNLCDYKVMNNLSVKTIIAIDTDNYTAWTLITRCIMANGSLHIAGGLMVMVKGKSTLQQSHNSLIFKDNLKFCDFPPFCLSLFHRLLNNSQIACEIALPNTAAVYRE